MIHVIGIGSPFGDDQIGWHVITKLQDINEINSQKKIKFFHCENPSSHLLNLMQGAERVYLVDAVKSNAPIGTLHFLKNNEIEIIEPSYSSHSICLGELMKLGKVLEILPENIIFFGIEIGEIQLNFEAELQIKLTQLIDKLKDELLCFLYRDD